MSKEPIATTIEFKEIDMSTLEDLFKPATALMIAVLETIQEHPDETVSCFNLVARAALNPPDKFADRIGDFAELFGVLGGIFRMAAEDELGDERLEPQLAKPSEELEEIGDIVEDDEPQPPEFLN